MRPLFYFHDYQICTAQWSIAVYSNRGTATNEEELSYLKGGLFIIGPTRIQAVSDRNPNLFGAGGNGSSFFKATS